MFGLFSILALIAYVALFRLILKRVHDRRIKYSLLFIIVAVPFGDEIVGRTYFEYLCAAKTGIHVYQTVTLPSAYWDANGEPNFLEANGNYHLESYPPQRHNSEYSATFHIDKMVISIINREAGSVLGDYTNYFYWGGWIRRGLSPHVTANSCGGSQQRSNKLKLSIFKQKS